MFSVALDDMPCAATEDTFSGAADGMSSATEVLSSVATEEMYSAQARRKV